MITVAIKIIINKFDVLKICLICSRETCSNQNVIYFWCY